MQRPDILHVLPELHGVGQAAHPHMRYLQTGHKEGACIAGEEFAATRPQYHREETGLKLLHHAVRRQIHSCACCIAGMHSLRSLLHSAQAVLHGRGIFGHRRGGWVRKGLQCGSIWRRHAKHDQIRWAAYAACVGGVDGKLGVQHQLW